MGLAIKGYRFPSQTYVESHINNSDDRNRQTREIQWNQPVGFVRSSRKRASKTENRYESCTAHCDRRIEPVADETRPALLLFHRPRLYSDILRVRIVEAKRLARARQRRFFVINGNRRRVHSQPIMEGSCEK